MYRIPTCILLLMILGIIAVLSSPDIPQMGIGRSDTNTMLIVVFRALASILLSSDQKKRFYMIGQ